MTLDPIAIPQTRYARAGDLDIAYQVFGDGPIDLVFVDQWFSHVDAMWDFPPLARLLNRLATFSRIIVFDKPGTRRSGPTAQPRPRDQDDRRRVPRDLRRTGARDPRRHGDP